MKATVFAALAPLLITTLGAAPLRAQSNPFDGDRMAIRAGQALFANRCADCHGADAKGFSGPDLTVMFAEGTPDERVFEIVREGVPGSIMPSSDAPDQEIWAMVAFVKSISTVPEFLSDVGDAARGAEIFDARCTRCHRVDGDGGRLGPDLSLIARVRTREALTRAIRNADADVARGYRPVVLTTQDGDFVRGVVKSEDAFSIQIMDTSQRLRGYLKDDLREIVRVAGSLMPEFDESRLPQPEMDDLLRYLATLRGTP